MGKPNFAPLALTEIFAWLTENKGKFHIGLVTSLRRKFCIIFHNVKPDVQKLPKKCH